MNFNILLVFHGLVLTHFYPVLCQQVPGIDYIEIFKISPKNDISRSDTDVYNDFDDYDIDPEEDYGITPDQDYDITPEQDYDITPEQEYNVTVEEEEYIQQAIINEEDIFIQPTETVTVAEIIETTEAEMTNENVTMGVNRKGYPSTTNENQIRRRMPRKKFIKENAVRYSDPMVPAGSHSHVSKLSPEEIEFLAKKRAHDAARAMYFNGLNNAIRESDLLSETVSMIETGEFEDIFNKGKKSRSRSARKLVHPKITYKENENRSYRKYAPIENNEHKEISSFEEDLFSENPEELVDFSSEFWESKGFKSHPLYNQLKKLPDYPGTNNLLQQSAIEIEPVNKEYERRKEQKTSSTSHLDRSMITNSLSNSYDYIENDHPDYIKLYVPIRTEHQELRKDQSLYPSKFQPPNIPFDSKKIFAVTPKPTTYRPIVHFTENDSSELHHSLGHHNKDNQYQPPVNKLRYLPPLYDKEEARFYMDPVLNKKFLKHIHHHKAVYTNKDQYLFQETPPSQPIVSSPVPTIYYEKPITDPPPRMSNRQGRNLHMETLMSHPYKFPKYGYDIDEFFEDFPEFGFFASREMAI